MAISKNGQKTKVVALYCTLPNLFELCSELLLLWRYEVKDFSHCHIFFSFFFAFFSMKTTSNDMISTHSES